MTSAFQSRGVQFDSPHDPGEGALAPCFQLRTPGLKEREAHTVGNGGAFGLQGCLSQESVLFH